ncbi:MAG: hypothetical protein JWM34_3170 [Ilumatobacteraceae bacterium]|nr:hypothetical protein [Ilumatobacteraceae bacterium]
MASITVRGSAITSVAPDRATLDLGLTHVAVTSSAALAEVARQSADVEAVLIRFGLPGTAWSTQGVSVAEEWEWRNDTNTRVGYRATTGVTATLIALDSVAPLLSAAVDEADAQIRDLRWSVSAEHPARRELLAGAALDAVQRADAYADALGLQRGAVEEVSDLPISSGFVVAPMQAMARSKAADTGPTMSVNGGLIELHASVDVRFTTLPR